MKKTIVGLGVIILVIGSLLLTLPFIWISRPFNFSVTVPKSQILLAEHFVIPSSNVTLVPSSNVTHSIHLNAEDNVSMIVNIRQVSETYNYTADVLDFYVSNGTQTFLSYSKISHLPAFFVWTVPYSANYSFVFDNSFSQSPKNVIFQLTNESSEIEHHTVTLNKPIISFEFAYLGVALILAGISLTIFGLTKKETLKIPPAP